MHVGRAPLDLFKHVARFLRIEVVVFYTRYKRADLAQRFLEIVARDMAEARKLFVESLERLVLQIKLCSVGAQRVFHFFAFSQITRHLGVSDHFTLSVMKGGNDDASPKATSILAHTPPFMGGLPIARGLGKEGLRKLALSILGGIEYAEVFSDDFGGGVALDILSTDIPVLDIALLVEQDDPVVLHFGHHTMIELATH